MEGEQKLWKAERRRLKKGSTEMILSCPHPGQYGCPEVPEKVGNPKTLLADWVTKMSDIWRKGKQPSAPAEKPVGETTANNEKTKVDAGADNGNNFDPEEFVDLEGDDIDAESQEADSKIREEFAARFPGKGKVESVPVDIFLSALGNLEKKLDKSFFALHNEIEEGEVLDAAWLKVRLSKLWDQYEYNFLTKVRRCLDRAIRMLSSSLRKDFVDIRDEVEARAVTLRLADNKGWSAALQIVGSNNKMMEKYKDCISLVGAVEPRSRASNWNYRSRPKYRQTKCKRYSSPSSDSERGETYKKASHIAEEQSCASTAVESGTSRLAAPHQVQKLPVNLELKTDNVLGLLYHKSSGYHAEREDYRDREVIASIVEKKKVSAQELAAIAGKVQSIKELSHTQRASSGECKMDSFEFEEAKRTSSLEAIEGKASIRQCIDNWLVSGSAVPSEIGIALMDQFTHRQSGRNHYSSKRRQTTVAKEFVEKVMGTIEQVRHLDKQGLLDSFRVQSGG
ncbi:hypothetical protein C2G38_2173594 [Gigaspora rosea]|uniref:Uncharacterized protein n=1 Tax=Gigaspora rosea TaxID=44941 RepID=A0A397VJE3_9GLOM|nr:hypothetical protein C2G38_2173594 [Gigaspora rosea]